MTLAFASALPRALSKNRLPSLALTPHRPLARWYASAHSPEAARSAISSENVMVFSTTYCPYCAQVKALFADLDVKHTVWELDQLAEGPEVRRFLADETGQTTVPNVFVGGKHVGGCDDTMMLYQEGKLLDMVNGGK